MPKSVLEPISKIHPCGSDYKYEDSFLKIENEIDKSISMIEGIETDWSKVLQETEYLLSNNTKDIKIMCWWTYSKFKINSVVGLEEALLIFNELLLLFSIQLFPKSKKVKISSLTWLEEMLNEELLDDKGALFISLDAQRFFTLFSDFQTNISKVIAEEILFFKKLKSIMQRSIKEKEEKKKENSVVKQTSLSSSNSAEISNIDSDSDANNVLRIIKKNAKLLQEYYREKDTSDLIAIRLVRFLSWLEVDELPIQKDGRTALNSPSQESIDTVEALISDENYVQALSKVENMILLSPFWMEGHFYAFNILTSMKHDKAAQEVKNLLVSFISSNKKIFELNFKNGTSFCSVELKKWIADNIDTPMINSDNENKEIDKKEQIKEQAYVFANKNNIKEAMGLLQSQHSSSASKEEKFYWRLIKAEMAIEFGKNSLALALIEDLKKDIETYHLDEWKPELAAKVYALFLGFNRTQVDIDDINKVYMRLCKIDIKQALEIKH